MVLSLAPWLIYHINAMPTTMQHRAKSHGAIAYNVECYLDAMAYDTDL
jgi:hypothetical protein